MIPEVLELLDLDGRDPLFGHLRDTLRAQVGALKTCQTESGLWCTTLLNEPESAGSYVEASATAGFAYGILKAKRKRYVGKGEDDGLMACAVKAVKGVMENISAEGELLNVSFGTGMGDTL